MVGNAEWLNKLDAIDTQNDKDLKKIVEDIKELHDNNESNDNIKHIDKRITESLKTKLIEDKKWIAQTLLDAMKDKVSIMQNNPEFVNLYTFLESIVSEKKDSNKTTETVKQSSNTKTPEEYPTIPFPHALSLDITDKAFDEIKNRWSEEFKVFCMAVQVLDRRACYMWGSPKIWDRVLEKVLKKLSDKKNLDKKNTEKVKDGLNNLNKNLDEIYKNLNDSYKFEHAKIDFVEDWWEVWKKINECMKKFEAQID